MDQKVCAGKPENRTTPGGSTGDDVEGSTSKIKRKDGLHLEGGRWYGERSGGPNFVRGVWAEIQTGGKEKNFSRETNLTKEEEKAL